MSLSNLIYLSTASPGLTSEEIGAILDTSRLRNRERAITGMLLLSRGNFMQVLEGEADALDETMRRILEDKRHHDVIVLEKEPILSRSFAEWSMGFRALEAADAASHEGFAPFFKNGFDVTAIGAKKGLALDLLLNFRVMNP